jgi:hypothetical protein
MTATVDVGDLQMRGQGHMQPRRIGRHQNGSMLHAVNGLKEAHDLLGAGNHRQIEGRLGDRIRAD